MAQLKKMKSPCDGQGDTLMARTPVDPKDLRILNLERRIYEQEQKIRAILDYLEREAGVELVRTVKDDFLKFAGI